MIIDREPKFGHSSLAKLSIVRDSSNMKYHDLYNKEKKKISIFEIIFHVKYEYSNMIKNVTSF